MASAIFSGLSPNKDDPSLSTFSCSAYWPSGDLDPVGVGRLKCTSSGFTHGFVAPWPPCEVLGRADEPAPALMLGGRPRLMVDVFPKLPRRAVSEADCLRLVKLGTRVRLFMLDRSYMLEAARLCVSWA